VTDDDGSDAWKEKAEQHPYRYRRDKDKQKKFTDAQKEWIEKFRDNAIKLHTEENELFDTKKRRRRKGQNNDEENKPKEKEENPVQRAKSLRAQARKALPKEQYKEIKEEMDEIHREIEREQIHRLGRMTNAAEKHHDWVPDEHDSDDEILYQPSRREPTFELDDDLEPRPMGAPPGRRKHTAGGWSEKWYKNNDVDYSDSGEFGKCPLFRDF
jgi:hypothetical protein